MPPKRKLANDVVASSDERRRTRSTIRAAEVTDTPRKRRRAARSGDDGPFAELSEAPKPLKTYKGARRNRKIEPPTDSAVTSPSAEDQSHSRAASEVSTSTAARLVLGAVELPTLRRKGKPGAKKSAGQTPASSQPAGGLNLKKSTARAKPRLPSPKTIEEEKECVPVIVDEPARLTPHASSSGRLRTPEPVEQTLVSLPKTLSHHQALLLQVQKQTILRRFADPSFNFEELNSSNPDESLPNQVALQQLEDILSGSIERSEGNSCLVLGPSGSGKSKVSPARL